MPDVTGVAGILAHRHECDLVRLARDDTQPLIAYNVDAAPERPPSAASILPHRADRCLAAMIGAIDQALAVRRPATSVTLNSAPGVRLIGAASRVVRASVQRSPPVWPGRSRSR